jgi:hypothetical protein
MNKANRLLWFVLLSFLVTGYCRADFSADIPSAGSSGLYFELQADGGGTTYSTLQSIVRFYDLTANPNTSGVDPAFQIGLEWETGSYSSSYDLFASDGNTDSIIVTKDASPMRAVFSVTIPNAIPGHHYVAVVTSSYSYNGNIYTYSPEAGVYDEYLYSYGLSLSWWIPSAI